MFIVLCDCMCNVYVSIFFLYLFPAVILCMCVFFIYAANLVTGGNVHNRRFFGDAGVRNTHPRKHFSVVRVRVYSYTVTVYSWGWVTRVRGQVGFRVLAYMVCGLGLCPGANVWGQMSSRGKQRGALDCHNGSAR